jgi:23S rRNA (guanosine2251-2'-O)-methyltransferase
VTAFAPSSELLKSSTLRSRLKNGSRDADQKKKGEIQGVSPAAYLPAAYCLLVMAIIYGIHPVEEALKAYPDKVEKICVDRGQRNPRLRDIISLAKEKHVPFSLEDRLWLDRKSEGARHQGVVCYVAEMPGYQAEDILELSGPRPLFLVLDGIEDPHNVGAILRSAEVAGADGVFLTQRHSPGLNATVVKASAGAASHIKVARVPNATRLLELLKEKGCWITGLDASSKRSIWEADFAIPTALVLGNEGTGLHRLVREKCDFLVSIPVKGKVSSHNVSVAAGIALYEALRQRHSVNDHDQ